MVKDGWIKRLGTAMVLSAAFSVSLSCADTAQAQLGKHLVGDSLSNQEGDATLEADRISYDAQNEVVRAQGNVQVFYGERILQADEIIYDAKNDKISATGKITLINPDGSVMVADFGSFDRAIENGLIRGARAVLADGHTRLAAVEGRRVDGRYTALSKAVYSPCDTCKRVDEPLWRIRARRVIQDEASQDIIYEDATFEVLGVPVAYLPFFRHADPTVKRRTGFLTPTISTDSDLGFSIKTPYFYDIAPNRDITLTPYISTDDNPVAEVEYRAWETYGKFTLGGSYTWSRDELQRGSRGHFYGSGRFEAPFGFAVGFNALYASDDTYLRRYNYSSSDRAEINIHADRYREKGFVQAEIVRLQSFREGEFAGGLPFVLPHITFDQRFDMPFLGGEIGIYGDSVFLHRTQGQDIARLSADLYWNRVLTSDAGFVLEATANLRGDLYSVEDSLTEDDGIKGRVVPLAAATLSYPLGKSTASAFHLIEPMVQLVAMPYAGNNADIPNEDSQDAELDDLNIFALNRFPGRDRIEYGHRATVGVRYQRIPHKNGMSIEATLGQTYRFRDNLSFTSQSGLQDQASDIVGSWSVSHEPFYKIGHRFRVSNELNFRRNEIYASIQPIPSLQLNGAYVFLDADPGAGSDYDRAEFRADGQLGVTDHWTVFGGVRRDLELSRFVDARSGIRYADECLELNFTVDRRFNSVEDAPAETNFGFAVKLKTLTGQ